VTADLIAKISVVFITLLPQIRASQQRLVALSATTGKDDFFSYEVAFSTSITIVIVTENVFILVVIWKRTVIRTPLHISSSQRFSALKFVIIISNNNQ